MRAYRVWMKHIAAGEYPWVSWFTLALSVAAFGKLLWAWIDRVLFNAQGGMHYDTSLYFVVGRGMLNGLQPYVDLFESKPPGMFLLSMASLALSADERPLVILQILLLLFFPLMIILATTGSRMFLQNVRHIRQWPLWCTVFAVGLLLTLLLERDSGGAQTELFGAFVACVYVCTLTTYRAAFSWLILLCRTLCLFGILALKEPFLLTVLAAVLILKTPRDILPVFIVPLLAAGMLWALFLLLIGVLLPYVSIYLPAMLVHRVQVPGFLPLPVRGFVFTPLAKHLLAAFWIPLPWYVVAPLWLVVPVLASMQFHPVRFPKKTLLLRVGLLIVALYLCAFAVGLGGYAERNHFAFSIPLYCAVAIFILRQCMYTPLAQKTSISITLISVLCLLYNPLASADRQKSIGMQLSSQAHREQTQQLDALLDACDIDRYSALGAEAFSFARHSPVGPLFIQSLHHYLDARHPLYLITRRNVRESKIVVMAQGSNPQRLSNYVTERFSSQPPLCAVPYLPLQGYDVLFQIQQ